MASTPARVHTESTSQYASPGVWVILEGYAYSTTGDCPPAAIAQLYHQQGLTGLQGLRGSHTLCLVDHERDIVVMGRDRLGGRTAFWAISSAGAVLSSQAALAASIAGVNARENDTHLATLYATGAPPMDGTTPFKGVHQLLPGGWLQCAPNGQPEAQRSRFPLPDRFNNTDDRFWIEDFRTRFRAAVEPALPQDTDTAVMLSGGLDSPPLAAVAAQSLAAQNREPPKTISWLLPEHPDSDESSWIAAVNKTLDVEPVTFDGESYQAFSWLDTDAILPDLPLYNPFRALIQRCYEQAAERGCSVILNGNAGDMLYPHYRFLLADMIQRGKWRSALGELRQRSARKGLRAMLYDPALRYVLRHYLPLLARARSRPRPRWLTGYALERVAGSTIWPPEAAHHPLPELARQLLGPSMAFGRAEESVFPARFGIERRDPFQDLGLVEWALAAPVSLSHRGGRDKWVMRAIMRGTLPDAIVDKKRTGLLHSFFASGFQANRRRIRELLMDERHTWRKFFAQDQLQAALSADEPSQTDTVLVCHAIGYTLWHQHWRVPA